MRLGGFQRRSGYFGEIYLLPRPGIEPRFVGRPDCGLVTIVTELSRLLSYDTSSHNRGVWRFVA